MKYTKEIIIELAKKVHGDKYDYSITEGVNTKADEIEYICPKHGKITQALHNHLQGKGCNKCAIENKGEKRCIKKEDFIKKASKNRNDLDKYDFDKTDFTYRDELGRIQLFCKEHGSFTIRPIHFINGVEGCKYCNGRKKDDEKVKEELSKIHPNLDFSEANYSERDRLGRIKAICPKHGIKYIQYHNLINGEGCYECSMREMGLRHRLSNEELIRRAEEEYGKGTYSYEKLDTLHRTEDGKIIITCPKHGDFSVSPYNFIYGKSGCPICRNSKLETKLAIFLKKNNIKYEQQKKFEWLKYKSYLYLDFYLPDYNIAIECQGKQHFEPIELFDYDEFENIQRRDKQKKKLCEEKGINVLYYMEKQFVKNEEDFSSMNKLIEFIKNNAQN